MTERDDAVSRRYRELPADEPPRALDEAILAASRRAVHTHPAPLVAPAGRQRWYVPLAAAAVIVLAVGLTLRVQLEQPAVEDVTPAQTTVLKDDAPKAAPRVESRAFSEEKPRSAQAPRREAQGAASAPSPFPAQPAEAPAVAAAPPPSGAPKAAQMRAAPAPRSDDAARDNAERGSAAGALSMKKHLQEAEETPEKMLERIAELRRAGKQDEADKALAEFRKRFPDYKLSDEMRAKVERPAPTPAR